MNLQLLDGGSWATVSPDETVPIKIMSIDTGAGVVSFPGGVQIAVVREDSTTALCEDSCSFADDGQCDEPGVVSDRGRGVSCLVIFTGKVTELSPVPRLFRSYAFGRRYCLRPFPPLFHPIVSPMRMVGVIACFRRLILCV